MNATRKTLPRLLALAALALCVAGGAAMGDEYDDLVKYDWSQGRATLAAIEAQIRDAATPAARQAIEARLIKVLAHPAATGPCKQFVCRMLRRVGSPACVPAVKPLLADAKLAHMARFALQHLEGDEAGAALRDALGRARGTVKLGIVASLGARRDPKAVPALAKLAVSDDVALARAAVNALGQIGTADAAKALSAVEAPEALASVRADATLLCADRALADGDAAAAAAIYRRMFAAGNAKMIRIAALRGIVMAEKEKAAPTLLKLMADADADVRRAAGKFVIEMPGAAATRAFAAALPGLAAEGQAALLDALTARGDAAAAPQVTRLATSQDESVRVAALRSLAILGDASSVPTLAKAMTAGGQVAQAATASLTQLKGDGVADAMAKLLDTGDGALRAGIIGVITSRADKSMAPVMLKLARDKDAAVRQAAAKGLGVVGGQDELAGIVALLLDSESSSEQAGIARTLASAARRVDDLGARSAAMIAGLAKADAKTKVRLVSVLGRLGGEKALDAVRGQLKAAAADVVTEAVRALESWPDASPADDLLGIVKTTRNPVHKVLAFRGYIRMANMPGQRSTADTIKMYQQALGLATTLDEKKAVLSGLGNAWSAEALKLVEPLLSDAGLKAEAELATIQIASNARDAAPTEARAALKKVIATTANRGLRKRAQGVISEMDRNRGYVRSWMGCGPYTAGDRFKTAYPPEKKDAKGVEWKRLKDGIGPQVIDLERAIGRGDNRTAYAKTHVWSPEEQDVQLQIGSDDGVKVWVGDKLVHANNANRPCRPGQDKAKAHLAKGWNPLMLKIAQGGGQWAFCIRIVKPDGSVLEGLRASVDGE